MRAALLAVLLAAIPAPGRAQSVDEICRSVASIDLTERVEVESKPAPCDAEALLYGIGVPADPAAALFCPARQSAAGDDSPFSARAC